MNFLTSNVFIRNGGESRSMKVFRSDHRFPARWVARVVREVSRALDPGKKGGYQQSIEPKVDEFAKHCCYWLGVVAADGLTKRKGGRAGRGNHVGARLARHAHELTTNAFCDQKSQF